VQSNLSTFRSGLAEIQTTCLSAVAAQADVLVSVDKDLLELRRFAGFSSVEPGEFRHLARA
jgi:predicted nucleic acid-binding protein